MSREGLFLVIGVNLVLTAVVVAAAIALYGPQAAPSPTPSPAKALEEKVAALEDARAADRKRIAELDLAVKDLEAGIAALRKGAPEPAGAGSTDAGHGEASAEAPVKESPTDQMGKVFAKLMQSQVKRQRDRYIRDLMDPTPASEARQTRMIGRIVDRVAQTLSLDERDKEQVRRILTQVDEERRETFRRIVRSHEKPDDIPYEEVKKAMDDSWEEEDRLIGQTLSPEKAKEYKKSAEPFRQLIEIAAKSAFPPRPADDKR